jgi:D-lactate dehydrogenase (cytochrome)
VLPVGAQSSVTGGATPVGGLVLSTERLLLIQDSGQHHVRADAGISLDALQKMLSARAAGTQQFEPYGVLLNL